MLTYSYPRSEVITSLMLRHCSSLYNIVKTYLNLMTGVSVTLWTNVMSLVVLYNVRFLYF